MTRTTPTISRAANLEKWVKNAGGTAAARRRTLTDIARIEALERKHQTRYDAKRPGANA